MSNVSLISAVVSVAGAVATATLGGVFEWRRLRAGRVQARLDLVGRYGDPLLQSSVSLAHRLANAIAMFSGKPVREADPGSRRQEEYNRFESLYRLATYLGWVQILRQEQHFLDMGNRRRNRRLMRRLSDVRTALGGQNAQSGGLFMLLGGEQQAIGELMVDPDSGERPRCLGYVAFRRRYRDDPEFAEWFAPVVAEIDDLVVRPEEAAARLIVVYNALVELIKFLDPKRMWEPDFDRSPLAITPASPS